MVPTQEELPQLSAKMEGRTPQEILAWAADTYGDRLAMATAFGAEGCALIAMLSQIRQNVYLFNLDTGYQFPETLDLRERLMDKYGVTVHLVSAEESVSAMESRFGGPLYSKDPDLCCHIRKVEPLPKAIEGYHAWISSIRRDQTPIRANAPIIGWDRKFQLAKIAPLANWSKKDIWNYILKNDVPYNPLHDQGYPSIGCWPCTRAVGAGEDERAGRWAGFAKVECGLHVVNG
ncbi:MAG TPA: phosphoadenylyl-sulfate reductase [Capsulimonadaceae bacterium]|nr:phosphoadenylyl-sulfate reductase [Capsulimonadaceae bacterium]